MLCWTMTLLKNKKKLKSPGFHVVDDTKVVLVPANTALHFMEEIPQLHKDNQACHGQPDVAKKLMRKYREERQKNS